MHCGKEARMDRTNLEKLLGQSNMISKTTKVKITLDTLKIGHLIHSLVFCLHPVINALALALAPTKG